MDDSDDEALFADFDADDHTSDLNMSANLLSELEMADKIQPAHLGDVDEGRITWEPPVSHGLTNSTTVSQATNSHWYLEQNQGATQSTPLTAVQPAASPLFAPPAATALFAFPWKAAEAQQPLAAGS